MPKFDLACPYQPAGDQPAAIDELVKGIRESASFNAGIVILKVAIVFFVIFVGAHYVRPANWRPFAPFGYQRVGAGIRGRNDPVVAFDDGLGFGTG